MEMRTLTSNMKQVRYTAKYIISSWKDYDSPFIIHYAIKIRIYLADFSVASISVSVTLVESEQAQIQPTRFSVAFSVSMVYHYGAPRRKTPRRKTRGYHLHRLQRRVRH